MAELQTINSSGVLTEIKLNAAAAGNALLTSDEIAALDTTVLSTAQAYTDTAAGTTLTYAGVNSNRTLVTLGANEAISRIEIISDASAVMTGVTIVSGSTNMTIGLTIGASEYVKPTVAEEQSLASPAISITGTWTAGTITVILTIKDLS